MTYNKKQMQPLIDKFQINPETNKLFAKIIEMYEQRRKIVVEQIEELQKTLEFIECHKNYHAACRDNDKETIKAEYAHCAALLKELKK